MRNVCYLVLPVPVSFRSQPPYYARSTVFRSLRFAGRLLPHGCITCSAALITMVVAQLHRLRGTRSFVHEFGHAESVPGVARSGGVHDLTGMRRITESDAVTAILPA